MEYKGYTINHDRGHYLVTGPEGTWPEGWTTDTVEEAKADIDYLSFLIALDKEEKIMGSVGTVATTPKYSNSEGTILKSTVRADDRFQKVASVEGIKEYRAEEILRTVMKMEENGETEGFVTVYEFERDEKNHQPFGKYLTAYTNALKAAGYKVTERENRDSLSPGYVGVRGRRVYAHTTKARLLRFKKI